jgi:hypothetical protein
MVIILRPTEIYVIFLNKLPTFLQTTFLIVVPGIDDSIVYFTLKLLEKSILYPLTNGHEITGCYNFL